MIELAKSANQSYVEIFGCVYRQDEPVAITMMTAVFCNCYAMMTQKDRAIAALSLLEIINDISDTKFEDGQDLVDFMKEKITEKNTQEKDDGKKTDHP